MSIQPDGLLHITVLGGVRGESIIVRLPDGGCGVIDCFSSSLVSEEGNPTVRHLSGLGITELEFLCLTHPHEDHYRGMSHLLNKFVVKNFWQFAGFTQFQLKQLTRYLFVRAESEEKLTSTEDLIRTFERVKQLRKANQIGFQYLSDFGIVHRSRPFIHGDQATSEVLIRAIAPSSHIVASYQDRLASCFNADGRPRPDMVNLDHNDISAAVLLEFGKTRLLLGGDVEKSEWERVLRAAPMHGVEIPCQGVKVSHHGSTNGYCDGLWPALSEEDKPTSVITPFKKYELPDPIAVSHVKEHSRVVYTTLCSATYLAANNPIDLPVNTPSRVVEGFELSALSASPRRAHAPGSCTLSYNDHGELVGEVLSGGAGTM